MAIIWVNATQQGGRKLSGETSYEIKRGSTQSGDVTVAVDMAKVTTKAQLKAAVEQIASTLLDILA